MAAIKISDLPSVETPTLSDVLPSVNNGETKKITLEQIKNLAGDGSGSLDSDFYTYYISNRQYTFINNSSTSISSTDYSFFEKIINKYRSIKTNPCLELRCNNQINNNSTTCLLTSLDYIGTPVTVVRFIGTTNNMNDSLSLNGFSQILLQFDVTSSEDKITIKSGTIYCFPIKFLHTLNTTSYTPTNNYHPATKKYVDDAISNTVGTIETTLQTINSGSGV